MNRLTEGSVLRALIRFSVPYLISCFLQTFYGLADLLITGWFYGASVITAVSVGSQITHMVTVILVGLSVGGTVVIGHHAGAGERSEISSDIGRIIVLFALIAAVLTGLLILVINSVISIMAVPAEAAGETEAYLRICFLGIPMIIAYNVISSVYRGLGDSRSPMWFVLIAGVINVVLDIFLIGGLHLGATGAAAATITAQTVSVGLAALFFVRKYREYVPNRKQCSLRGAGNILKIGIPVAAQDGLIQVSFLVITVIANQRGLVIAASVGIVEKIISFLFLVPSAMLSSVSVTVSHNAGAGLHQRAETALRRAVMICVCYGVLICAVCQASAPQILGLFTRDEPEVIRLGAQYLRAYSIDCILAGIHFCYSGYFSAYGRSGLSFIHNIASVLLFRIPGAYLASICFPDTLFPMGLAAPCGSCFSDLLCTVFHRSVRRGINAGEKIIQDQTSI